MRSSPDSTGHRRAMEKGPRLGCAIAGAVVRLSENCIADQDSTPAAFRTAGRRAARRALEASNAEILEPFMTLEVTVPTERVGSVLSDLNSSRRGQVLTVGGSDDDDDAGGGPSATHAISTVEARVPLREMIGYSTALRSLTSGEGNFSMEYEGFEPVLSSMAQDEIAQEIQELQEV